MTGPATISGTAGPTAPDTSRLDTRANLDAAGAQFEAIFVRMMLSSMRSARLSDGLFESQAIDQFRDMQDQQLAQNMARHTPLGIGKAMTEFLSSSQPEAGDGSGGDA